MTDGQLLLAALVAFTLLECARWVPARAWIFQAAQGGSWRASLPWRLFRRQGGGIVLLKPVPPMEAHLVTASWPCAPHDEGLAVWDDDSGAIRVVPWDQTGARAEGAVVHVTGEVRTRCPNAAMAAAWAGRIRSWSGLQPSQRAEDFLQHANAMLDVQRITDAASVLQEQTRWLRQIGACIFWWTFLALPLLYWRFADGWPIFAATGCLFLLMFAQATLLWRGMRTGPSKDIDDLMHLVSMALFPPSAMRAADRVCGVRSPEAHPLAALKAWGQPAALEAAAARMWRVSRWPIGRISDLPWNGPEVRALAAWFEENDLPVAAFDAAPEPQDGCSRWCPRCQVQYAAPATRCADCGGMPLADLPGHTAPTEAAGR